MDETTKWKPGIFDEKEGQVVRILRPKEFHALVDNVEVETETKWKFLQRHDITTDDVRAWSNFLMYTGCRFPEAVLVHSDPSKYDGRGILRIPNYKGKAMRSIKARNIFLSYRGREVLKDFFESQQMPSETYQDVVDTMRALTVILHESGKTIGLPEQTFTLRRKRKVKEHGVVKMEKKQVTKVVRVEGKPTIVETEIEVPVINVTTQQHTTNGCNIRSFRHSWESWLYWGKGNEGPTTLSQIILSQGHRQNISMEHYLNFGFDKKDDLEDIKKEVEGFGEVG